MTLASNGLENSVPYKWTYADATARTTDTGFTADDVGKFALQLDTGSLYRLTATTPTWQLAAGTGDMLSTNNLSDVANVATARTNLGLGTAATHDVPASGDASATQVPLGNDSRLSDARTPTAHATSHQSGGSDAFTGIMPGSAFAPAGLTGATAASRYVGATASGAPASGTFAVGDFVIDQTAKIWICTVAGSPGTWTQLSGGGGGGAPTSTPYLTTASDATLTAEVAIPGLAASPDIKGAGGGGTVSEEYDTTTTGLTWTPSTPTVDSNTTAKSHLYVALPDSTERFGLRAWAPGSGAFDARCHLSKSADNLGTAGLLITDSGNTNRLLLLMLTATGPVLGGTEGSTGFYPQYEVGAYTYTGGTYTLRSNANHALNIGPARYLRIARDASNNVTYYYSYDGIIWTTLGTYSFTLTVANIGYRADSSAKFASDWLRTNV